MEAVGVRGIVVAVAVGLLASYFIGIHQNRRRGRTLARGLAAGFAGLHASPKIQWIGSSAFQVTAEQPLDRFRHLTIVVVPEPREILLFWIFNRLRGRGDTLVAKGDFDNPPRWEVEVCDPGTPTGREGVRAAAAAGWTRTNVAEQSRLRWAYPADQAHRHARWSPILKGVPFRIQRLSVRRSSPHVLLSVTPSPGEFPGPRLFDTLRAIAVEAAPSR